MSAIIWWLESPWQLRAIVFILSFFVCFVGPWLHSQTLLTSRLLARKPVSEKSQPVPSPKVETLVQHWEKLVQEKTPVQPSQAPAKPEAPVQEQRAAIKPEAPAVKEEVPAQPAPVAGKAEAPAQPAEAADKEEAAAQPETPGAQPAHSEAPVAQHFANGFDIVSKNTAVLPIPGGCPVDKQDFAVATESGGAADVEVFVLSNTASWAVRSSDRFVDSSNRRTDLSAFLDSDAFAKAAARYNAVICVGLGSRSATLSPQEVVRLIDHRAAHLCGVISRKPYVSENTKLYGLPLGQPADSAAAMSDKERKQRSLIIIGVRSAKGDLADAAVQKKLISEIVRSDKIANFPLSSYSEAAPGRELRYIEVKGGNFPYKNKPVSDAKPVKGGLKDGSAKMGAVSRPSARVASPSGWRTESLENPREPTPCCRPPIATRTQEG